ncbi:MAG: hypothetical protein WCS37_12830 [Chloroflexota bacterium]|nr:hypothetical protein [Chloroflexota bacterium]
MSELIERVALYQNRLTLDLTEWLISHNKSLLASEEAGREPEALLQCWVRLLVESTLESIRLNEPRLLADFFVVLRDRGGFLHVPPLWQAGLVKLYYYYRNLFKPVSDTLQPVTGPRQGQKEWFAKSNHSECNADLLEGLNRTISAGLVELEVSQVGLTRMAAFPSFVLN